jgi:acetyl esterase/lipase
MLKKRMCRLSLLIFISFCCCLITIGQDRTLQDPDWVKQLAPKRIVYSVPGMNAVEVRKNITYKTVAGESLKMDVYSSPGGKTSRPAIFFIHGGRVPRNLLTTPKDWGAFVSYGQLAAVSGFVGVTFNHRFYAWESLPDSQSDVNDAIAYLREHAVSFGVDKNRIVLWAVSAGGIFLSDALQKNPPYLRCLVALYAELDLQSERNAAPPTVSDEMLRQFSPLFFLGQREKQIPPIFVARAGLDDHEMNAGIDRFVQLATSRNLTIDFMTHPTGHHGFDVDDDNARSREIIKRAIEFVHAHSARRVN